MIKKCKLIVNTDRCGNNCLAMENMDWSTSQYKSESLAAESLAADMDRWITYRQRHQPYEIFEQWLNKNLPSCHYRSEGVGWICVRGNQVEKVEGLGDLRGLHQMWDEVQKSNRPINVETISDLARIFKVTNGKWLFHVDSGAKADHLWSIVAKAIVKGEIPCKSAKVSPYDDCAENNDKFEHVVCVYNDNYLNEEEVMDCEHGLRKIGIKCPLMYKPDVYTYLGVYRNNPWDLRPTVYRSEYDVISGKSQIDFSSAPGHR
ncbi:UPF0696 protein C11orf68 homolog,UPF0696 protein C11orf68 [Mytilus coruscus]|uniref:UPF0696 protein C11orf68 homolog,UPF0696 protein C11orf68 n=1 Tax=Mytilus coruscus TaxID=42192 RepID=A0A6J8A2H2_MYTCO|nr:UPF0696 protein C11orf68 homolog,UPF0696 protein C11orf68 [Mytilus coruscus]